jgi:hypothetical protein
MKRFAAIAVFLVVSASTALGQDPRLRWQVPIDWQNIQPYDWQSRVAVELDDFCDSWGFESDSFTNWTCQTGKFGAANQNVNCATSGQHALVAAGSDPQGMPQVGVDGGARAVRLGDMAPGDVVNGEQQKGNAAAMSRTFTVTQKNKSLRYSYALVLQDPDHASSERPYFNVTVTVGGMVRYSFAKRANGDDPFFADGGKALLRRWSCDVVDLAPYLGQQATIRFESGDCEPGGHYGYAYIDFPCDPAQINLALPQRSCEGAPLLADGTANDGVADHFWSVERSDANYGRNPGEEVMSWFDGPVTGPFDIEAFAAQQGRPMTCGNYYRVKLAVKTECEPWLETTKLIYIDCVPPVNAGPDRRICATDPHEVTIGQPPDPGVDYRWKANGVYISDSSTITVFPTETTIYELTASNQFCSKTSTVRVDVIHDFEPGIAICYCAPSLTLLTATMPGYNGPKPKYVWSTGETTESIAVDQHVSTAIGSPSSYSVTIDTGCNVHSASVTLPGVPKMSLIAPNTIVPYSAIAENRVMRVDHLGMGGDEKPAYEATEYILTVFDAWDAPIYEGRSAIPTCAGIGNGDILWDARANISDLAHNIRAGDIVPIGAYTYLLEIVDCQEHVRQVKVNGETRPVVYVVN